ncbi:histidine phosphatase family protein [Metabacillus malikii]|uniref:Broad specificity phosphatase PhoE n=1 Tax=Metabacillus malikii TaxID=1504265 RepID=A0ABT9ZD21_9BACI|nr:histidine phosphatase family protein [Metabacillus malikii]MDQ0230132.1 broad specificity phosphatase PhoE [Metabacillus malikii]
MNTFYLVRHGIKEKSVGDVSLSLTGIKQAKKTADYIKDKQINYIFTSPLQRAKETAKYISAKTKTKVIEDIRLRERANWGDIQGQSFEAFVEIWNKCSINRDYIPPSGISAKQTGQRLEQFIIDCTNQFSNRKTVAVTHGGIITDFMINVFSNEQLRKLHPNFIATQSQLIPECSITVIRYDGHTYDIDDFASFTHLTSD